MKNFTKFFLATGGLIILFAPAAMAQQTVGGSTAPGSTLDVRGSLGANYNQLSATTTAYTMTATDFYLVYTNNSAAGTITLPAAGSGVAPLTASLKGRLYNIKNTTATRTLTVNTNSTGETIDGSVSVSVPPGQSVQLVSSGLAAGTGGAANATWEIVTFSSATSTPPLTVANNGLNVSTPGTVQLGGTLLKNTDVALAGFNQTFSGTGNVGIGTTTPAQVLDIVTQNTGNDNIHLTSYNSTPSPALRFRSATGTAASPSFVSVATTAFGSLNNAVWNGSAFTDVSAIRSFATETHSATGLGANLTFSTTANGTTTITERMRIDQNGQVGIGTTTPHSVLDLGTIVTGRKLALYDNAAGTDFYGFGLSNNLLQFHVGAATAAADMTLNSLGDLLITGATATKGGSSTTWTITSDRRAKKNIQTYQLGLKEVLALKPVTFQYNGKFGQTDTNSRCVGVIAQEIEKVLPGTVITQEREGVKDFKTFNASEITFTLINAVQEMQAEIEALRAANAKLQAQAEGAAKAQAELQGVKASLHGLAEQVKALQAGGSTASSQ